MKLQAEGFTVLSPQRTNPTDFFFIDPALKLYGVADFLNDLPQSRTHAEQGLQTIKEFLRGYPSEQDPKTCMELMQAALVQLNARAIKDNKEPSIAHKNISSMDILWVRDRHAILAHVGNTRSYIFRAGDLHQITEDHLYGVELVKQAILKPEELTRSPLSNILTRAIGQTEYLQPEIHAIELGKDDCFGLTTNGLYRAMELKQMTTFYKESAKDFDLKEMAETMARLAARNDPRDHATVLFVRAYESKVYSAQAIPTEQRLKLLGQVFLFRHLSYSEANKVLNLCKLTPYKTGEWICKEGEASQDMYIVASGQVQIFKGDQPIAVTQIGETIGEMALIDQQPRSASIQAKSDSWLLSISRKDFLGLLNGDQVMGNKMLWSMLVDLTYRFRKRDKEVYPHKA